MFLSERSFPCIYEVIKMVCQSILSPPLEGRDNAILKYNLQIATKQQGLLQLISERSEVGNAPMTSEIKDTWFSSLSY